MHASSFSHPVCSDLHPTPLPLSPSYSSPLSVATVWHAIVALRPLKVIVLLANMHQMGNISTLHGFLFLGAQPCCNWPHHQRQQQHHQLEGASTNRVGSQLGSSSTWHIDYVATSPPDTTATAMYQLRRLLIGNTLGRWKKEGHPSHRLKSLPQSYCFCLFTLCLFVCFPYVSKEIQTRATCDRQLTHSRSYTPHSTHSNWPRKFETNKSEQQRHNYGGRGGLFWNN